MNVVSTPMLEKSSGLCRSLEGDLLIRKCRKSLPVPRLLPFSLLHSPVPENSGPWSQARSPSRSQTCVAWRNVKCLFQHLGMQKVSLQRPEEFYDMGECEKNLWVTGKMSWYQSLVMEFSDGKLNQKGFFHSVGTT